jgi:hypothetical protein
MTKGSSGDGGFDRLCGLERGKAQEAHSPQTVAEDDIAAASGFHDQGSEGAGEPARRPVSVPARGVPG